MLRVDLLFPVNEQLGEELVGRRLLLLLLDWWIVWLDLFGVKRRRNDLSVLRRLLGLLIAASSVLLELRLFELSVNLFQILVIVLVFTCLLLEELDLVPQPLDLVLNHSQKTTT